MIQNLEIWLIDQVGHPNGSQFFEDVGFKLNMGNFSLSGAKIQNATLISFSLQDMVAQVPNFGNAISSLPALMFVDVDRDIGVHLVQGVNIIEHAESAMRHVTTLSFSEPIGEFVNKNGFIVPRVLFRNPDTGIFEIIKSTFNNQISKSLWGGAFIFSAFNALSSNSKLGQIGFGSAAVLALNKYLNSRNSNNI